MGSSFSEDDRENVKKLVTDAACDDRLASSRMDLAKFSSETFKEVGDHLNLLGHMFGELKDDGKSGFGRRNDEIVGMSILLRIGSQLVSASSELLSRGHAYAGAALLRQVVEVEYLAWAFENRDRDAERWLQSDPETRSKFFRPSKLLDAAEGNFRGKDYGYHCELGGHPMPSTAAMLLKEDDSGTHQLLLSDLLGHTGSIWDSFVGWAKLNERYTSQFKTHSLEMSTRFRAWKSCDPLLGLPPPP